MKTNAPPNITVDKVPDLSAGELESIRATLGREPGATELRLFTLLWQEKISFKNTIYHIKRLPRDHNNSLHRGGEEATGFTDLGDGLAATVLLHTASPGKDLFADNLAMRISGVKYLGHTAWVKPGKSGTADIAGINLPSSKTGNGKGMNDIPVAYFFDDDHEMKPLVSLLTAGVANVHHVVTATAKGAGNPVYLVSACADEKQFNGFLDEIVKAGAASGMGLIGQGGIIMAAANMASRAKQGMIIHANNISCSDENSDIAERLVNRHHGSLLLVCDKERNTEIELLLKFWKIPWFLVGEVTGGSDLSIVSGHEVLAQLPSGSIVAGLGAPVLRRESTEPEYHQKLKRFNIDSVPQPGDLRPVVRRLLAHPNIRSYKKATAEAMNQDSIKPDPDSGCLYIPGTEKALIISICCNPRYVYSDPKAGTEITVAEAARQIVCRGGRPQALSANMNFKNIDNPDSFWQYAQSAKGLNNACRKFNLAVTRTSLNFENTCDDQAENRPHFPEPVIGMMGVADNRNEMPGEGFRSKGDVIFLLGESRNDINSSQYLVTFHKVSASPPPYFNADKEFILQHHILGLINSRLINSAHSISTGGLFITLVKAGLRSGLGFDITTDSDIREDAFLFGEAQSRVVVTVGPENESEFIDFMYNSPVQSTLLGHVTKGAIRVDDISFGTIDDMRGTWSQPLAE